MFFNFETFAQYVRLLYFAKDKQRDTCFLFEQRLNKQCSFEINQWILKLDQYWDVENNK